MQAIRNFVDAITYPFRILARIPSSVVSSPRRMLGLSLPARSALLLFFGLLTIDIIWIILRVWREDIEQWGPFLWRTLTPIILLTIFIPIVFWYALKLWLQGERSPFPEIDRTWASALEAMSEQGIDPSETPIFLVIGPPSEKSASDFFAASHIQMPVHVPTGPAPLHVFANGQAIYIVCTGTSCVGTLLAGPVAGPVTGAPDPASPAPAYNAMQTMQVGVDPSPPPVAAEPAPGAPFGIGETPGTDPPISRAAIQGTMMLDQAGGLPPGINVPAPVATPRLDPGQSGQATAKLSYLCRCLRRIRDPLCPINGVLVTTPFTLLADGTQEAVNQLQLALKADLATVRSATRVRCSVTHIVRGMEEEPGFRELIRRVGSDRVATQRFGKGFGLWNLPTPDQLDALVRHACGAFEDWSYLLFREEEGLSKRGNRHLYGLLCRIRMNFRGRLSHLIQSVYSVDTSAPAIANREPLLFSGCYFVASGHSPDRHAFLASVLQKSQVEEEELEWGSEAIGEESRLQTGVQILLVLNGILFAAILALLFYVYKIRA